MNTLTDKEILDKLQQASRITLVETDDGLVVGDTYVLDNNEKVIKLSISLNIENEVLLTKFYQAHIEYLIKIISRLKSLTYLKISKAGLINIKPLTNLKNLEYLILPNNRIASVELINKLNKLKYLDLSNNKITSVIPLLQCRELFIIFLSNNQLNEIPLEFFKFNFDKSKNYGLEEIIFIKNYLVSSQHYETAAQIRHLEKYIINGGKPNTEINEKVAQLASFFSLNNNPLVSPPFNIILEGNESIHNYFKQLRKESGETQFLFEAKLLVIGEGGTGKTTFTRKIKDAEAELPNAQDTTLGIDVNKWTFDIRVAEFLDELVKFHVNIWDFGGQKLYYGTHQIFFSDKSFYVLVGDTREQKTDFSYWLNTVEQLGGNDSSVLILLNKKYSHEQKFDESGYRSHFGTLIKEVVQIDLKNENEKIINLQDKLKVYLKDLPGIGASLPLSWVKVREELSKETKKFISFDQYRKICSNYGITSPSMIHTLSGYFNRIGVITHYIDDPILQERIYLDSNWLVKTVYEVLDNKIAKLKKGRLNKTDIEEIWGSNELHYEVNRLTQLMHNFGLMYHITRSDDFVVPAHLSTITPYEQWHYSHERSILVFIYEFNKYMPQGIMTRLIVALNHHIEDHNLVWHRGVNIAANGSHAEIVESYGGSNRFEIRIVGNNKIELLSVIRERFTEVLKPFQGLNYKQFVPCNCEECRESNEPAFHEYNLLLKFREKQTGSQCSKTGLLISPDELLKITEYIESNITPAKEEHKGLNTIKIFLASSSELEDDRRAMREFISVENDRLHKKGVYLEIVQWEYFLDSMSKERLQEEYNKALKECDIFLSLFFTKVGRYTAQEFESAFGQFVETGKPKIFTYFKAAPLNSNNLIEKDTQSKFKFERKLKKLGHFKTVYIDINDLKVQFKKQLEYTFSL